MADVLRVRSSQAECSFAPESRQISPGTSHDPRLIHNSSYVEASSGAMLYPAISVGVEAKTPASIPSSAPSSPRQHNNDSSSQNSLLSTPSSSLSLSDACYEGDEQEQRYDGESQGYGSDELRFPYFCSEQDSNPGVPPSSPHDESDDGALTTIADDRFIKGKKISLAQPDLTYQSVGDDTALFREPSRHVDYLSHDWHEEDIWCSWRHIVSRRSYLENSQRLENASWRTWAKFRNGLKTVSPEKLNWLKDHDVTWLYGPLQTFNPQSIYLDSPANNGVHRAESLSAKKPILKKRSVSEIMLRRSLSNSTLVRQAVDALATQDIVRREPRSKSKSCAESNCEPRQKSVAYMGRFVGYSPLLDTSTNPSGVQTPVTEKKHIHFNNEVEQCIAINEDLDESNDLRWRNVQDDVGEDSSDDGIIMMHAEKGKEHKLSQANGPIRSTVPTEQDANKTIAMLPSTTLKYRGDSPEPPDPVSVYATEAEGLGRKMIHSVSSETLRPTRSSTNFLLDDDDEDIDMSWQPTPVPQANNQWAAYSRSGWGLGASAHDDEDSEHKGLRRTPSGMLMPDEDDEDGDTSGLFGKVLDTVNTARDIAHVIWNVGWRR